MLLSKIKKTSCVPAEERSSLNFSQRLALAFLVMLVILTIVVRPLVLKSEPTGDFMIFFRWTKQFWSGQSMYGGGNPYLPSTYVVMAYQTLLPPHSAWFVWRVLGIAVVAAFACVCHRFLSRDLGLWRGTVALANILLISGMSPWSGNPGNLAGMTTVLAYSLLVAGYPIWGGVALGLACSLKYSIGLPFVILALASRQRRFGLAAAAVFGAATGIGLCHAWSHGISPAQILNSLMRGVMHWGGYEKTGFDRWFSVTNPYRFQLMNLTPLFNTFGFDRTTANLICTMGLGFGLVTALYCALRRRPAFLTAAALFSPFFLLCSYHRFYESAIIAFPVLLAWTSCSAELRVWSWIIIITSCTLFLSFSNIMQTRLFPGLIAADSWWWNYLVGPHHVYALVLMAVATTTVALRSPFRGEADKKPELWQ
ncbi:MAG: glycosyltransferase 87 family protein [Thermogutta sp.]